MASWFSGEAVRARSLLIQSAYISPDKWCHGLFRTPACKYLLGLQSIYLRSSVKGHHASYGPLCTERPITTFGKMTYVISTSYCGLSMWLWYMVAILLQCPWQCCVCVDSGGGCFNALSWWGFVVSPPMCPYRIWCQRLQMIMRVRSVLNTALGLYWSQGYVFDWLCVGLCIVLVSLWQFKCFSEIKRYSLINGMTKEDPHVCTVVVHACLCHCEYVVICSLQSSGTSDDF